MKVYAFESCDWALATENGLTEEKATEVIEKAVDKAQKLLPTLSQHLNIIVRPHFLHVIPEYGTGGFCHDSECIEITFDKTVPFGVDRTLESFYQTVFHETNHAARYNSIKFDGRFINSIVTEGLATVFERDKAKHQPLYGVYEDDATMHQWFNEVSADDWDKRDDLMFLHPDGRKWIGYKTGTWLIDQAMRKSGKTVVELTGLPADDIIQHAGI